MSNWLILDLAGAVVKSNTQIIIFMFRIFYLITKLFDKVDLETGKRILSRTYCGSSAYAAPEILQVKKTNKN